MDQPDHHRSGSYPIDLTQVRVPNTFHPLGVEAVLKARRLRVVMADSSEVVLDEPQGQVS